MTTNKTHTEQVAWDASQAQTTDKENQEQRSQKNMHNISRSDPSPYPLNTEAVLGLKDIQITLNDT